MTSSCFYSFRTAKPGPFPRGEHWLFLNAVFLHANQAKCRALFIPTDFNGSWKYSRSSRVGPWTEEEPAGTQESPDGSDLRSRSSLVSCHWTWPVPDSSEEAVGAQSRQRYDKLFLISNWLVQDLKQSRSNSCPKHCYRLWGQIWVALLSVVCSCPWLFLCLNTCITDDSITGKWCSAGKKRLSFPL